MHRMDSPFEWDDRKRRTNIEKHAIDFVDAKEIWNGEVLEVSSPRSERREQRFVAWGLMEGKVIAVVYT